MASLKLTATMSILMLVIFLWPMKTGFGLKQTGPCRPVCTGNDCITVNRDSVDFKTAEEACRVRNGELLTVQPETDESILHNLSQELFGNFWIGLRLPAGSCSNLSAPLRGYEWSSGSTHRSFIPSFGVWKDEVKVCSPRCVSLSNEEKWTERLCSDKTDGYLCRTKRKDACQAQEVSNVKFFQSSERCSASPCEHKCTDVKGGYECSCFSGYIPDNKNPRRCKMYCGQQRCRKICDRHGTCFCPDGFIEDEEFCLDIDECLVETCDHKCKNTFGGFACSCHKGFVLKGQEQCIKVNDSESLVVTTPVAIGSVAPAAKNDTQASSASAGGFLWIWIFFAVAVVVFIFVVRFYVVKRQRRIEQNSSQQSTAAPLDNIECGR